MIKSGERYQVGDVVMCMETPDPHAQFKAGMTGVVVKNPKSGNGCSALSFNIIDQTGVLTKKFYAYWEEHDHCYELYKPALPPKPLKKKVDKERLAKIIRDEVTILKNLR